MLRLTCSALLLLIASSPQAQIARPAAPRIRVPGGERPIEIAALDVRVLIHGLQAETTQTVTFFNPNGRVLEGELEFPLPDGAAVAGFGLDVDGRLVDGVVVARDKARVVLETEIRRGVDPGLVEQVRGNLHRARIYPIPARGTRTVRLRWISELTTRGEEAAYHLPLPYDRPIGEVAMRVEVLRAHGEPEVAGGFGNLAPRRWDDRWVAEARWAGAAASRDLLVRLPRLPAQLVDVEPGEGGEAFFTVSDTVPARSRTAVASPRRIALAWDGSGSRDAEAIDREVAFLKRLLAAWPAAAVDLVVFRDRSERPVAFPAGDGGRKLLGALRAVPLDGGTALAALDLGRAALPHAEDDLWILCSDGLGTLGEALPRYGDVPVWTVTGASVADRPLLRHLSAATGGELLDLLSLDAESAAGALLKPPTRLLRASASTSPAGAVADLQVAQRADRARVTVTGRLLADEAEVTLHFGTGRTVTEKRVVKVRRAAAARAGDGPGPVAIAWAQGRSEALSLFPDRNGDELVAVGRRFGLVTAGTSLLVLETLAQHLEHEVEPPATRPALRTEYLARVVQVKKAKQREEKEHLEAVVRLWADRVKWWETEFRVPPGWRWAEPKHEMERARGMAFETRDDASAARSPAPAAPMAMAAAPAEARAAKKAAIAGPAGTEASIAIKPWDPRVPYLEPLRRAAPGAAYAAYLAERARSASPAFFLDCAEFFLRAGDEALGIRILSNLAELRIDDPALLRVLAWRLAQARELDLAAAVLEKVLRLRPEDPQSKRDLALVLADRAEAARRPADAQRAVDLLYDVALRRWDRFPEIEIIALMELNRIIARADARGWAGALRIERFDRRLLKLLDVDLRVSLSWDADLTDVDLHVFEPTGEHAFFGHRLTAVGGLVSHDITQGYGPEEYVVRKAAAGRHAVKVHYYGSRQQTLVGPATITATVFTNWGRPNEKREVLTLRLDNPKDLEEVGVVTVGPDSRRALERASE